MNRWLNGIACLLVFGVLIVSCSDSTGPSGPTGELIDASGCNDGTKVHGTDQDCIEYEYDGQGTLTIRHLNTAFNCCPEYTATVGVEDDAVTITEVEALGQCDCTCLYDLEFRVSDLPAGSYDLTVVQEYLGVDDPVHVLELDLDGEAEGEDCIVRERYPWY